MGYQAGTLMAKTRQHDAQDVAEVQENDGGLQ